LTAERDNTRQKARDDTAKVWRHGAQDAQNCHTTTFKARDSQHFGYSSDTTQSAGSTTKSADRDISLISVFKPARLNFDDVLQWRWLKRIEL